MYSEKTLTDKVQRFLRPDIGANILHSEVSEATCRSNLTTTEKIKSVKSKFCEQEIEQEFKKQNNKKLWHKIDKNRKKAVYGNMFWWVIHSSFWLYQFVQHLGEMHEACRRFVVFFWLKSGPRARWRAGEDTAECHCGIMLAIISSHHIWCHAPWTRAHTFAMFPSIEMPPLSISILHTATEKAQKINWTEEQTDQSIHVWWKCSNV